MAHRFFISPENIFDQKAVADGDEAHHLRRVLRLKEGDEVRIFDGSGREVRAVIEEVRSKDVLLRVVEELKDEVESPLAITLVQGLIKGDRFEFAVQKAVELGVGRLLPLVSRYSDVRLSEARAEKRLERWRRIVLEASKQSGRRRLMEVLPPADWNEFAAKAAKPVVFFAERGGESLNRIEEKLSGERIQSITVVVGSEGGWSEEELADAASMGFHLVTIGLRVLRAETATVAAVSLIQYLFGDLR